MLLVEAVFDFEFFSAIVFSTIVFSVIAGGLGRFISRNFFGSTIFCADISLTVFVPETFGARFCVFETAESNNDSCVEDRVLEAVFVGCFIGCFGAIFTVSVARFLFDLVVADEGNCAVERIETVGLMNLALCLIGALLVFGVDFEDTDLITSAAEMVLVDGITSTRIMGNVVNETSESGLILLHK